MKFEQVTVPATDPSTLSEWYGTLFGAVLDTSGSAPEIQLDETTLSFEAVEEPPPVHLAFRLMCSAEEAVDWLADRATILPVEGESSRWFEFLDATAIYFDDPEGNVLEGLCYKGDPRRSRDSGAVVDGVTEVGVPAHEPLALVEWFEETVGLSAWGTPSETFAWVGDREARFVVVPTGREWYPTDRDSGLTPVSVTVVDETADSGRYYHPKLPYEIQVNESN